jgi:uncharacterized LabA/DUF88 family protein
VDVDLTMHVIGKINHYDQAVLVTNDGDFAPLVSYLIGKNKLQAVLSPNRAKCSYLLRRAGQGRLHYLDWLRSKIERT